MITATVPTTTGSRLPYTPEGNPDVTAWDDIRDLIGKCDADGVTALVLTLDADGRREIAKQLPGHLKEVRRYLDLWRGAGEHAEALRAAGAGTIATAASVASWLTRRGLVGADSTVDDTPRLLRLVCTRPHAWQADLAQRLAGRLRGRDPSYELTAALIRETGIEAPTDDGFVVGWVSGGTADQPLDDVLAGDPLLDALLPRIFEAQGVGEALKWESDPDSSYSWLGALHALATRGRVDRGMMLDGCLRRFLRGGTAQELRFFVRLHEALDPAVTEIEPRAGDYLRLLPSAPGTVAELALNHLRRMDPPEPEDFGEAVESLMFRQERKMVRAGLSWIDQVVRYAPGHAEAAAGALAMTFGHEMYDLKERAVRLAVKHADGMSADTLRDAAGALPPDLRARLATVVSGIEVEAQPPHTAALTPVRLELPPPITTVAELAASVAGFAHGPEHWDDWLSVERLMAGLVELTYRDRAAVQKALVPIKALISTMGQGFHWWATGASELHPVRLLLAACQNLLAEDPRTPPILPYLPQKYPLHQFVLRRAAEVFTALRTGGLPPVLLATPTTVSGHVDPVELVSRLERLETAGTEPFPTDLEQALLRIPRSVEPETVARAARLSSSAGKLVARWMAGEGRVTPQVTIRHRYLDGASWHWFDDGMPPRYSCKDPQLVPFVSAPATGLEGIDSLFHVSSFRYTECMTWWLGIMPSETEAAAAHLLAFSMVDRRLIALESVSLGEFAGATEPLGPVAANLLLARLNSADPARRASLLGTLAALAATGHLPGHDLGDQLGLLVTYDLATLSRITPALVETARTGFGTQAWPIVAAALPTSFPPAGSKVFTAWPPSSRSAPIRFRRARARRSPAWRRSSPAAAPAGWSARPPA
ncbi:DUF7824 domain-containing protein [Streptosporangium subroseum]|uniref:DUF7824 domain-containing protein n=1 Tax=Streptosporangium subroseum TaxID=106412 RepID=UPI0030922768|nr:DUF6493 family protein [Streptosporangium subroseum]